MVLVGDLVAPHVSGNWNNSLNAGVGYFNNISPYRIIWYNVGEEMMQ